MPKTSGIEAIKDIRETHPNLPILVMSMYDSIDIVKRAIETGASGYLLKNAAQLELVNAVRSLAAGGGYYSPCITYKLLQPSEITINSALTNRQVEILKLIAHGQSAKEIGFTLGLSSKTVDVQRSRIMARLNERSIPGLTLLALRNGLVTA